jgi:4-methyl-5(b-hydroxyethyl)-thiazole monophosphate biosynthesis
MTNSSYLFLATGFEEIEALTVVDVMRRAGMDIKTVSITDQVEVTGAHGVTVSADLLFTETTFDNPEWLIIPGGMPGTANLATYQPLNELLLKQAQNGKIAAICAAPALVLSPLGILDGKEATCYRGMESLCSGAIMRDAPVIALDRIITGNGPASAMRFALAIVANSLGESAAQEIGSDMLYYQKSLNFYF